MSRSALYPGVRSVENGVHEPPGRLRRWNSTLVVSAEALAPSVTTPDAIGGALIETAGGSLSTTTVIPAEVVELPARSVTTT